MKRRISIIVLLAALTLPLAPAAFAHDFGPRRVIVDGGYTVVYHPRSHPGAPPHWLRTHAPFQHWYHASRYRYVHRLSWPQLYDLYRIEVRHSRPVRHYHYRGCRHDRHDDRRRHRHR